MTGFIVSVFPFRNRVSSKEAFEELELGEGKPSRPVLRGPGGRKAAWLLGNYSETRFAEINGDLPQADFGEICDAAGVARHGRDQFARNTNISSRGLTDSPL